MSCRCSSRSATDPDWWNNLIRHKDAECFNSSDIGLNLFGILTGIKESIDNYIDNSTKRGKSVLSLTFRLEGGANLTNGQIISEILQKSPFNLKIIGFGASILDFPTSAGASSIDDSLSIRLYDYTASAYLSDSIVLTKAEPQGSITNDGDIISSNNAGVGHNFGIKMTYSNSDSGEFIQPDIDIFIIVEPQELTYTDDT